MKDVAALLDKCRAVRSLRTDAELAAELRVTKQTVSGWRHGARLPDAVACGRIAQISGEPLARVLGIVGEARAVSSDEKRVWRQLATAAALALVCMLPITNADAKVNGATPYALCEVVRALTRRMADWLAARSRYASPAVLA